MRTWHFWLNTLVLSSHYNPPWFVELVMTALAMVLLLRWGITNDWPYMVLSSSYAIGAAASIWVREVISPSPHPRLMPVVALLLIIYSLLGFAELVH